MTSPEVIFTICRRTTASPYHILKSLVAVAITAGVAVGIGVAVAVALGSLRSYYGDADDNVD